MQGIVVMNPRGCCWREMGRQDGSVHGGQALAPLQHPASGEPGSSGVAWHGRRRRRRRQRRQVTWKESGPRINAPRREGRSYQFERNSEVSRRAWFSVFRTNYSAYSGSLTWVLERFKDFERGSRGLQADHDDDEDDMLAQRRGDMSWIKVACV